jgi:hypothetical protein
MPASRLQQAQVAERRARAIALRVAHVPLAAIADQLGYSSPAAVSVDIRRALERRRDELRDQADTLTALESEKLDALEQRMWRVIGRRHLLVSNGRLMSGPDGQPLVDDDPAVRAAAVLLRALERRARLHGLDQPARVQARVDVRDDLDADIERLVRELAAAGGPAVPGGAAAGSA